MDCSASFSCSLGSPMVRRPLDHQQMNAVLLRTEISIGSAQSFAISLEPSQNNSEMQNWPLRLYDRARLLDNHRIKYLNSIYENFKTEPDIDAARIL